MSWAWLKSVGRAESSTCRGMLRAEADRSGETFKRRSRETMGNDALREKGAARAPAVRLSHRRGGLGRQLLAAFLLLTLVPLIGISIATTWRQYEHSRMQIIDQLTSVATLKEAEVKTWFNSLSPDLELLVADPHARASMTGLISGQQDRAMLVTWRNTLLETSRAVLVAGHKFDEVFLMDATGRVIVATNPNREGQAFVAQPFFQKGLNAPYVQSPFYSLAYDKMVVFAAVPVCDEKGIAQGVLAGVTSLDTLNRIMRERSGLGQTGETYLVSSDYIMLTEPRYASLGGFPAVHTQGANAALAGINGFGLYENYQYPAAPIVGVYRWIPELRVALLAEQSQAEAFATTFQNIWTMLGITIVVAMVTAGAAIVVARGIATPLEHLTSLATRMAGGDLTQIARIERDDEIGILTDTFNLMTAQLRELIGGLEERVAARTAELEAQTQALRRSEQRLALHVQQTPLAVIEWDLGFRVIDWNPGAEKIFGYSKDQAVGRHAAGLIVPESAREQVDKVWNELVTNRGGARSTNDNVTQDGRIVCCEWDNTPLIDQTGNVVGVASLVQDVTVRKQAEEQLERYSVELAQSNEELRRFAYIVSHDLRAPLVNLKGFAAELASSLAAIQPALNSALPHVDEKHKAMVTDALGQDIPEALGFIEASVTRMDHFINALLKLSRLGRTELVRVAVSMDALVQDTLETLAHQIEQRHVRVTVGSLPEVAADRTSMEQIMGNILNNAVLYLEPGRPGQIEISGEHGEGETIFRVHDNGRGIAPEDMDKIFAPFRRAGRQDVPGEGMGLAYVQTLVRRHGGRIWCESELGAGTTFTFTIPDHLTLGDNHAA